MTPAAAQAAIPHPWGERTEIQPEWACTNYGKMDHYHGICTNCMDNFNRWLLGRPAIKKGEKHGN